MPGDGKRAARRYQGERNTDVKGSNTHYNAVKGTDRDDQTGNFGRLHRALLALALVGGMTERAEAGPATVTLAGTIDGSVNGILLADNTPFTVSQASGRRPISRAAATALMPIRG